jgi:signal transduction histidine kinase
VVVRARASKKGQERTRPRPGAGAYYWLISLSWIVGASFGAYRVLPLVLSHLAAAWPWVALVALVHLLPIRGWRSSTLAIDIPVAIAIALVWSPLEAGLIGFFGAFDTREFGRQITLTKTIFNRSQTGITYLAQSFVVHHLVSSPANGRYVVLLAFAAMLVENCVNYLLIGIALSWEHGYPFGDVLRRLRMGTWSDYLLSFVAWAVLGSMLATLYEQIGTVALLAFLGPLLWSRQVLMTSQMFVDTSKAYEARREALTEIARQASAERTDERRLIAADLHDEILPALFNVSLMAQVVKTDLATGRLLEVDQDLPGLLDAAEVASRSLRELIGDLRRSPLGREGLASAVRRLVKNLEASVAIDIEESVADVEVSPETQLVCYQIAREALSNAAYHSRARQIRLTLDADPSLIVLQVSDDGTGFDPDAQSVGHFGIRIMRERAASIGAILALDSSPGRGTTLTLTCPT